MLPLLQQLHLNENDVIQYGRVKVHVSVEIRNLCIHFRLGCLVKVVAMVMTMMAFHTRVWSEMMLEVNFLRVL